MKIFLETVVIVIVDYGMGNLASIQNMIKKVGGEAVVSSNPEELLNASALIFPGVGAFDNAITKLEESGLKDSILNFVESGRPFLGICLGMQLLLDGSEEGELKGLGLIKGKAKKFSFDDPGLKVPHMGWNKVTPKNGAEKTLYKGLEEENRFYFVHSFHVECEEPADVFATADYGIEFVCSVNRGNVYGAQFHPEKSHKFGMKFFENFLSTI